MPEPRPLYNLQKLPDADRVFVVEGEKAADAVCAPGAGGNHQPARVEERGKGRLGAVEWQAGCDSARCR